MLETIKKNIKYRYGSKSGLLNSCKYRVLTVLGAFNKYRNLDLSKTKRFVFICAGNICRSPLAEAVAHQANIATASYGLHCRGGDNADPRAIAYAEKNGLNLNTHITRNIKDYVPQPGDLLIAMEPRHLKVLEKLFKDQVQITLAGLWLDKRKAYLHDPFNACEDFFKSCEDDVAEAVRKMVKGVNQ